MSGALAHDYDLRDVDAPVVHVICGCCQRLRAKAEDVRMFGTLTDAGGKQWRICGKCIRTMWKRAPKPEPIEMLCA